MFGGLRQMGTSIGRTIKDLFIGYVAFLSAILFPLSYPSNILKNQESVVEMKEISICVCGSLVRQWSIEIRFLFVEYLLLQNGNSAKKALTLLIAGGGAIRMDGNHFFGDISKHMVCTQISHTSIYEMSTPNDASGSSSTSTHNFALLGICAKVILDGSNYNDWMRNIKMALRFEDKEYVLEKPLDEIDEETATPEELVAYKKHYNDATKVACVMVSTMTPELQRNYEDYWSYEMNKDLMEKYHKRARQEKYEVVKSLLASKMKEGESVSNHVQRMQRYVDRLIKLNVNVDDELAIDIVFNSLLSCYDQFILTYHLNNNETTLSQLLNLLRTAEAGMKGTSISSTPASTPVLAIGQNKGKKRKAPPKGNWNGKTHVKPGSDIVPTPNPKEATCFYCSEKGHWRRSCPKYLQDLKDGKVKPTSAGTKGK